MSDPGPRPAPDPAAMVDPPACPQDWCRRPNVRAYREAVCAERGWPADHHVLVEGPDGTYCWCTCLGCDEWCTSPEGMVAVYQACRQAGLPPGSSVRVQRPDGSWCDCTCGLGMPECEDQFCSTGEPYWSLTQMCGQDQLWRVIPQPARVMFGRVSGLCYCNCAANVRYCYSPVCTDSSQITKVIAQCTQEGVAYQQFVSVPGNDGSGSGTCSCPCPYPMCTGCSDPVVAEYVREVCDEMHYWEGYPVAMAIQGAPCTCLCPPRTAQAMRVGAPAAAEGEAAARRLLDTGAGDPVLAAGVALEWRPAAVLSRASVHPLTPITAVNVEADGDAVTLAPDQLVLTAERRLKPALALEPGDRLATPDGGEQAVREVRPLPRYSAPLPFLALAHDPPDASLAGRLLALNRLVVGTTRCSSSRCSAGSPRGC